MAQTDAYESGRRAREYASGVLPAIGEAVSGANRAVAQGARKAISGVVQPAAAFTRGALGLASGEPDFGREGMQRPGMPGIAVAPDFGREGMQRPVTNAPVPYSEPKPSRTTPSWGVEPLAPSPARAIDQSVRTDIDPSRQMAGWAAEDRERSDNLWRQIQNERMLEDEKPLPGGNRVAIIGDTSLTGLARDALARKAASRSETEQGLTRRAELTERGLASRATGELAAKERGEGALESRFAREQAARAKEGEATRGLEREKIGARAGEFGQTQALEREKMDVGSEESRARAGLLGVQTEAAGYGLESAKRTSAAQKVLDNPQKYSPEQVAGAKAFLDRGLQERIAFEQAKARARVEAEGFANGGEVRQNYFGPSAAWEKVKTGAMGALGMSAKEPAPAPAALPTRTAEPDPSKGMWELSPEEQAALPKYGYADGGAVGGDPRLARFGRDVAQAPAPEVDPRLAKYGAYLQAASKSGITPVNFAQFGTLTQGVDQQMRAPVGYADGGDVSALERPLRGPGTGTSDSIPAVIDGVRPAALSTGEFVFDEATTKYYGTKFLKDLQRKAKEAEQGVKDGE